MGDTSYESFYNGGISSLDSNYGSAEGSYTGARMYASNLGFPGSAQTANQLNEAINAVKQGVKSFEVTMGQSAIAEQIPIQHFEEMRALMKLSGVKPTVHAPFDIDPSGFAGQQGYSEENREENERRFFQTLEKAAVLNKGNGNTPVVFHSSGGLPGIQYKKGENGEMIPFKGAVVNKETGQMAPVEEEREYYPSHAKTLDPSKPLSEQGKLYSMQERIKNINETQWDNQINGVINEKKINDEILHSITENPAVVDLFEPIKSEEEAKKFSELQKKNPMAYNQLQKYNNLYQHNHSAFGSIFNTAYKNGSEEERKILAGMAKEWQKEQEDIIKKSGGNPYSIAVNLSNILDKRITEFVEKIETPQIFVPIEDFAREKAAETFGNLAWKSYKKLGGEKAPVLAVENMFAGEWAHSTGEGMRKLIDDSRNKFIEQARINGMGEKEAKNVAEKLIGVTWDVGHLNMIKKHGFGDKEVVKMTEQIAPYVKHVHLTDNFGYSDSHLAPGMGNVPIKQILEKLEKGGVDLRQVTKTVEAPGFVQHFKRSPHGWTMAALGSPIYGAMMGPYWNQVAGATAGGGYFGFPYAHLPEKHFSTYGSGFSSLPEELGGQIPGSASRFSGTNNA